MLYTFAFGCWGEISERFEEEAGPVHKITWRIYVLILLTSLVTAPMFYAAFEVEWGVSLFDYGVNGDTSKCITTHAEGLFALNTTTPQCDCPSNRAGTAGSASCTEETYKVRPSVGEPTVSPGLAPPKSGSG